MFNFIYRTKYSYFFIAIILLAIMTLFLRLHHLDFESLFMDEIRQVSFYENSINEIIANAASQQQPPLDYWIGHFIYKRRYFRTWFAHHPIRIFLAPYHGYQLERYFLFV